MSHPNAANSLDAPTYGWSKPVGEKLGTKTGLAKAQRDGLVDSELKYGAPNHKLGPSNSRQLEEDTGNYRNREITSDFKKALMQARAAKKMTQKDLAQAVNVAPSIIQQYEQGKAVPDGGLINKLNRALGITLPKIPKQKVAAA